MSEILSFDFLRVLKPLTLLCLFGSGDAAPQRGGSGPGAAQPAERRLGARRRDQSLLPVQPADRPRGTQSEDVW